MIRALIHFFVLLAMFFLIGSFFAVVAHGQTLNM